MRPATRTLLVLAQAFVASGALALATLGTRYDVLGVAPWALVIGGPVGVYALAPVGAAQARTWARGAALLLPVAALAFLLHEGGGHLRALASGGDVSRVGALVALHALLVLALLGALVARRRQLAPASRSFAVGWPLLVVGFAPVLGDLLGLLVMGLQGALLAALLRPAPGSFMGPSRVASS